LKKRRSPSPFGVRKKHKDSRKRGIASSFEQFMECMKVGKFSCFLVIVVMLGAAALLALSAANQAVGVAWGNLSDSRAGNEFILPSSGFIVVEMASVVLDEEGNENGFDSNALLRLRGRRGEPGLLQLGDAFSGGERTAFNSPSDVAGSGTPLSLANFDWPLSEQFGERVFSGGAFGKPEASRMKGIQFKFPERLVERGISNGGNGPFTNFGVSRVTDFRPIPTGGFALGGNSFANANGSLFEDSGISRLFSLKSSKESREEESDSSDSERSDFESVLLSALDDGKKISLEDGEEREDDVLLAQVDVLWKEHIVKSGETLSDIAIAHGVSVNDIVKANELKNPNRLSAKQLLLIPNDADTVEATLEEVLTRKARIVAAREQVIPVKVTAYVIAEGDSLWSIANAQNLEIDTLFGCNDLRNPDMIRPGTTLRVPNQDGIFYKIQSGNTLAGIAQKYGVPVDRIRKANPKEDLGTLVAGKEIFLPGARPEAAEAPAPRASSRSSSSRTSSSVSGASRNYRWPVVGRINSPFGWRSHPVTRRRDFHTGIDIKAPRGRAIHAARGGTVDYSGWMGGYGRVVVINHGDGHSTLYAHCNSLSVRKGQRVSHGQAIATVGTTGRTTGPHLHFEVRRGNNPVNPLGLLR